MEHISSEIAQAFVRETLSADARGRWEAHLLTCHACRNLVDRERSWAGLLKLGKEPGRSSGDGEDRPLPHVEPIVVGRIGRWGQFAPAAIVAVLLGVTLGLTCRLAGQRAQTNSPQAHSAVRNPSERDMIAHMDALQTLAGDPWLTDGYEAARWLKALVQTDVGG